MILRGGLLTVILAVVLYSCKKDGNSPSSIKLSQETAVFDANGGTLDLEIDCNTEFHILNSENWLEYEHQSSKSRSSGKQNVTITISPNNDLSDRKTYLLFKSADNQTEAVLQITQTGGAITSFKFRAEDNPEYLTEDLIMSIDEKEITVRTPQYLNLKNLIATFDSRAVTVEVDGVEQVSGSTLNDFNKPLTYSLSFPSGEKVEYTVKVTSFTGLPAMFITTQGKVDVTSKDDYLTASIKIDGLSEFPDLDKEVQIKGRGNSTWGFPKKPYRLKFDKKESVLGFPAHKSWVLLANYLDKTAQRNEIAFVMSRFTDLEWTPRSQFVELFLNERYDGTYQLVEMIKIAKDRVNVSDDGFIVEIDHISKKQPDDIDFSTPRLRFVIKDPDVTAGDSHYDFIKGYVNNVESVLFGDDYLDPVDGYRKYIDIESFVDWYLVNEITKNNDAIFFSSCYMNYAPGGKLKMGPVWDFDLAFGNINTNNCDDPIGFYIKNASWYTRLFTDPEFISCVKERYQAFRLRTLDILNHINTNAPYLQWSALENNNRWGILYQPAEATDAVWGSYNREVQFMRNWLNQRLTWLDNAIMEL